jgi:hypothetical protein
MQSGRMSTHDLCMQIALDTSECPLVRSQALLVAVQIISMIGTIHYTYTLSSEKCTLLQRPRQETQGALYSLLRPRLLARVQLRIQPCYWAVYEQLAWHCRYTSTTYPITTTNTHATIELVCRREPSRGDTGSTGPEASAPIDGTDERSVGQGAAR